MGITLDKRIDLPLRGHFKLSLFDVETNDLIGVREADNLLMTGGLNLLARGINWAIIQNQNAIWGSPFTAINLGDLWGAVGTSNAAPVSSQVGLTAEIGRAIVSAAAVGGNQLVYDFFIGAPVGNGIITEVGAFMQAGFVNPALTIALANLSNYSSLSVTSTVSDIPAGSVLTIGYGTGQTQQVITTTDTPPSSTTINVVTFTANSNYSGNSIVAYLPGTMLDRTVITPITKSPSMTGILEITLTLISG